MPSLKEWLFGADEKLKQVPTMNPEQSQLLQMLLGGLSGQGGLTNQAMQYLQQLLTPGSEGMKAFEEPYRQEFEQKTIPGLAERFAGAGAQSGALSSSGFGQALGTAGSNLQTQLAALRGGLQQQGAQSAFGLGQQALGQSPFAYHQQEASSGFLAPFLSSLASNSPYLRK